jgi:hypothetical protein
MDLSSSEKGISYSPLEKKVISLEDCGIFKKRDIRVATDWVKPSTYSSTEVMKTTVTFIG